MTEKKIKFDEFDLGEIVKEIALQKKIKLSDIKKMPEIKPKSHFNEYLKKDTASIKFLKQLSQALDFNFFQLFIPEKIKQIKDLEIEVKELKEKAERLESENRIYKETMSILNTLKPPTS